MNKNTCGLVNRKQKRILVENNHGCFTYRTNHVVRSQQQRHSDVFGKGIPWPKRLAISTSELAFIEYASRRRT
jgi:hypothetical protein